MVGNGMKTRPTVVSVLETSLGRIAALMLPRMSSELYQDEEDLVRVIVEALEMAGRLGARTVSLTGLIPSATEYGRRIATAVTGRKNVPAITTGHATTAAAVVLSIRRILEESGRNLAQEQVGFLGLGSVGLASLHLMVGSLPHPLEITLCDVYDKLNTLADIRRELVADFGFQGPVRISASAGEVPSELYDATLIIGATNVPDVLDVTKLNPGTMIVDDSGPHCFVLKDALRRLEEQPDLLFTGGGVLRSPDPIRQGRYVPRGAERVVNRAQMDALLSYEPFHITGCVLSGLLSACFEHLKPTVGLTDRRSCFQHYEVLGRLGFQAADLHCAGNMLPTEFVRKFRSRFGGTGTGAPGKELSGNQPLTSSTGGQHARR